VTSEVCRTRRSLAIAGLVAALAMVAAGCGGSSSDAASGSPAATSSQAGSSQLLDAQQLTVLDQQIAYPKKKPAQVTSSVTSLEPGQETGWRKNNTPMYSYVLDGTLTVEYDAGVTKEYPAGTAFMQAQGVYFNGMNKGDQPTHILVVSIGAKGVKNSVKRSN
jgi:quercetin dioxygenase-like cupin family protein